MAIDATNVQVLKEPGRRAEKKSFMWARGSPELGIVLFDYDPSGGGKIAKKLMEGYEGALQADAHRGYGALDQTKLKLLGCMMHSRRRFYEAFLIGKKAPGYASEALTRGDKAVEPSADREGAEVESGRKRNALLHRRIHRAYGFSLRRKLRNR